MKNNRILAKGIEISNDTKVTGLNNNDMIIGSSGSGKTGGYVIPNLQSISGSMVVSDTKCQLARSLSNVRRQTLKEERSSTLSQTNRKTTVGIEIFAKTLFWGKLDTIAIY